MSQEINVKKEAVPEIISLGETTTITYFIRNLTTSLITKLTIDDPLFRMPGIHVRVIVGGIYQEIDGIIALTLPIGGLPKSATFTCAIAVTPSAKSVPSETKYHTLATVCGIASGNPKLTFCDTARCKLYINGAKLIITNHATPEGPRRIGDQIKFTIKIHNVGNTEAKIHPKYFTDSWTDNHLTKITISDKRFSVAPSYIYNNEVLYLNPGDEIIVTLDATIQ